MSLLPNFEKTIWETQLFVYPTSTAPLLSNKFNPSFVQVAIYSGEVGFSSAPGNESQLVETDRSTSVETTYFW